MSLRPETLALSSVDGLLTAEALYDAILGRNGEDAGLDYWTGAYEAGASASAVASAMFASDEAQARFAGLDEAQSINLLYQSMLGRDADAGGLQFWADSGLTIPEIAAAILNTQEYGNHQNEHLAAFSIQAHDGATFDGSGQLEDFNPPVVIVGQPTPEAHRVTYDETFGSLPDDLLKDDGTFNSGNGTANAGFYGVVDHDAAAGAYLRVHERQAAVSEEAITITASGGHVTYEFEVDAGSQNGSDGGGVNPARGDTSVDFGIAKNFLADPDLTFEFEFGSLLGTENERVVTGELVAIDADSFQIVSTGGAGIPNGTVLIADFNPSTDGLANSTNLGFGIFAGNPDVPEGDYSFTIRGIDTTGLDAGREVFGVTALMHAIDPAIPEVMA